MTIKNHHINVGNFTIGNDLPLVIIAGPCALESRDHAFHMSGLLKEIAGRVGVNLIYKSSFDKANRTSLNAGRGMGLDKSLPIFADIRKETGLPFITDVHTPEQCAEVASVVDVLQTPAFLCRQTDLIVAAAKTGKPVNVKKGQFLAPWDMKNIAAKFTDSGNPNIMLCERGASFGYNTLVSDMRSLPIMAETGHPVVFDATHSVQAPGGNGTTTGGDRRMVPPLARAAVATGSCAAVFIETHDNPEKSPSDGPNMVRIEDMEVLLRQLVEIDRLMKPEAYAKARKAA